VPRHWLASSKPVGELAEALLVSSGSFRVDRKRMIEVLGRFQSADPYTFLLPWLRLAVASGAQRIALKNSTESLELTFDGKPLEERWCKDPFAPLLEGDEENDAEAERHKQLSRGLLALLPLEPDAVAVDSGKVRLRLQPKEAGEPSWLEAGAPTTIRVKLPRAFAARALERAKDAWGLADAQLTIDGRKLPSWEPAPGVGERFEEDRVRGVLYRAEGEAPPVRVYHLGVALDGVDASLPKGVTGRISYDGISLDASQAKPVQDAAFKGAVKSTRKACAELRQAGKLGEGSPVLRAFAYTKGGVYATAAAAVLSFSLLVAGADARPEVAWAAAIVYSATTAGVLLVLGAWFLARLSGRRNPFKA
ncbi:MAG: hypothetical protein HY925_05750, partial [Elusimicrobia bacterium]|nr:hypothetical protein [Elusimicrobiota bacterium]